MSFRDLEKEIFKLTSSNGVDKGKPLRKNVFMPPKSKTSKAKEEIVAEETSVGTPEESSSIGVKEETKTPEAETPEKAVDVSNVPAWRAEVVEEGGEETPTEEPKAEKPKEEAPEVESLEDTGKATETLGEVKPEEIPTLDLTMPEDGGGGKGKKVFIIVFILVLILGLVAGGFYYYKTKVSGGEEGAKEGTPTPSAQETLTPTPSDEVDLSEYKVSILNGSGIPGEAGKVETALKSQGFETIETANAESYDYTDSEVSLKKDIPEAVYEAVKEAMSGYKIVRQESDLAESSEFDVEIIVGTAKSGSTPTPTATPSATKTPTPTP